MQKFYYTPIEAQLAQIYYEALGYLCEIYDISPQILRDAWGNNTIVIDCYLLQFL